MALRIFRKDVRHLWPLIVLVLAIHAVSIWLNRPGVDRDMFADLLDVIVDVAPLILTVAAIHGESLCDHRQFWLTRPYNWKSLLAAKALFVFAFANLPFFVADIIRCATYGLPLPLQIAHLLWRQVCLTAWLFLGTIAVAAVTATMVQTVLAALGFVLVPAAASFWGRLDFWGRYHWMRGVVEPGVIAIVAAAVILMQYRARRTVAARVVLAVGFVFALFSIGLVPFKPAFAVQSRLDGAIPEAKDVQIAFAPASCAAAQAVHGRPGETVIQFPIRLSGVPKAAAPAFDVGRVRIETPGLSTWDSGWGRRVEFLNSTAMIAMSGREYERRKDLPFEVHATVALTLLADDPNIVSATKAGRVVLPTGESCFVDNWFPRAPLVSCQSFSGRVGASVAAEDPTEREAPAWTPPLPMRPYFRGPAHREPARRMAPAQVLSVRSYGPNPIDIEPVPFTWGIHQFRQWIPAQNWYWGERPTPIGEAFGSGGRILFIQRRPVAHLLREFTARGDRLSCYYYSNLPVVR